MHSSSISIQKPLHSEAQTLSTLILAQDLQAFRQFLNRHPYWDYSFHSFSLATSQSCLLFSSFDSTIALLNALDLLAHTSWNEGFFMLWDHAHAQNLQHPQTFRHPSQWNNPSYPGPLLHRIQTTPEIQSFLIAHHRDRILNRLSNPSYPHESSLLEFHNLLLPLFQKAFSRRHPDAAKTSFLLTHYTSFFESYCDSLHSQISLHSHFQSFFEQSFLSQSPEIIRPVFETLLHLKVPLSIAPSDLSYFCERFRYHPRAYDLFVLIEDFCTTLNLTNPEQCLPLEAKYASMWRLDSFWGPIIDAHLERQCLRESFRAASVTTTASSKRI